MTRGQIVLFSVAALVITSIIMFNVTPQIVRAVNTPGGSGLPAIALIFLGAAGLVGGVVMILSLRAKQRGAAVGGVLVSLGGATAMICGVAVAMSAGG